MNNNRSTTIVQDTAATDKFARMLATENIHILHSGRATTASFNMTTRQLILPKWEKMSGTLYDMLVAHEVGHALFTPEIGEIIKETSERLSCSEMVVKGYINVVEDARIERLMKDKFPGLRKDFYLGYKNLNDRRFFGNIDGDLSFIDRINLHFKLGTIGTSFSFSDEEDVIVDDIIECDTFDDVMQIVEQLIKSEQEQRQDSSSCPTIPCPSNGQQENESDDDGYGNGNVPMNGNGNVPMDENENTESENTDSSDSSNSDAEDGNPTENNSDDNGSIKDIDCPSTVTHMEDNMKEFSNGGSRWYSGGSDDILFKFPEVDMDDVIIDWNSCYDRMNSWYPSEVDSGSRGEIKKFIADSKKICNVMVQDFMRKQSAASFHKATIAKTGILNMETVINYRWSEDIFRKSTILPKGKNHGLVILVDWSGSMCVSMRDTIRQAIQMAMFCRMLDIPFELFSFSTVGQNCSTTGKETIKWETEDDRYVSGRLSAMSNYLSSQMPKNVFYHACELMAIMAEGWSAFSDVRVQRPDQLGATPLDDALLALSSWLPKYARKNSIEKMNLLVLSDGHSTSTPFGQDAVFHDKHKYFRVHDYDTTNQALDMIRYKVPGITLTEFFLQPRKRNVPSMFNEEDYRKNGWAIHSSPEGYDAKFLIHSTNAVKNTDAFESLTGEETHTKIRSTFVKTMKKTSTSRTMLNRFIDIIA
jgi:hypothetical protein